MDSPAARCLDITRLVSRLGRGVATGIDRVEIAYLEHLIADPVPCSLFLKTWAGYLLVAPNQAGEVADRLMGSAKWGRDEILGVLRRKAHPEKRKAEATIRRLSVAKCRRGGLAKMLSAHVPAGISYFNVGHSNLTSDVLEAWRNVGETSVLIHDAIPLEYPEYQRSGTVVGFEQKFRTVLSYASRVVCISKVTEASVARWAKEWALPDVHTLVSPIGVSTPEIDHTALPVHLAQLKRPYFVTLGTIEPRKNHALLLDIWQDFVRQLPVRDIPRLVIVGARGWENAEVFTRLDGSPLMERQIFEVNNLPDSALGALLHGSAGLLFPTRAEGFGLPPMEALALGVPVICSDLPVLRENLGDFPIYAPVDDMYLWKQSILQVAGHKPRQTGDGDVLGQFVPTIWKDHFNLVLKGK